MESLSIFLSASPPFLNHHKTLINAIPKSTIFTSNSPPTFPSSACSFHYNPLRRTSNLVKTQTHSSNDFPKNLSFLNLSEDFLKTHFNFLLLGLSFPLSSFASEESTLPTEEVSNKINLEAILVSIDNFFNKYPFFVATVTFIWLVVIPLTQDYLQKYKFISAVNAFRKLQDDSNAQLLDIRDRKSLAYLGSPNLKILNKTTLQVEFREGNEDVFVKNVVENFVDPANTTLCIIDNFDGNSLKVAELLVKNGFKEAYAVRGGIRGKNGWQEIQETLLPSSVHVYPKKKAKLSKELDTNGNVLQQPKNNSESSAKISNSNNNNKEIDEKDISSVDTTLQSKHGQRPSSPYPNYPDFKPPSSPTPSKPRS